MDADHVILTAASRAQARGFRAELGRDRAWLARVGDVSVVPDAGDRRIGSGASTLLALWRLWRRASRRAARSGASEPPNWLEDRRVLLVHGGGDSRRLPAYAAQGKLFAPVGADRASAREMIDAIVEDLLGVASPGRVVVATGDVYLGIAGLEVGDDPAAGIIGVAFRGTLDQAARHGVYVADAPAQREGGGIDRPRPVRAFVQKPSAAEAAAIGAVGPDGGVLIDTGVVSLSAGQVLRWLRLAGVREDASLDPNGVLARAIRGESGALDLYADMLTGRDAHPWTSGEPGAAEPNFRVVTPPRCEFMHVGTTREILDRLVGRSDEERHRTRIVRSIADARATRGRAFIDACDLGTREVSLAGENVVVGIGRGDAPIRLPLGIGLACAPVRDARGPAWSCVAFGLDDDFKSAEDAGGTLAGRTLAETDRALGPLWDAPERERSLWTARLWRVGTMDEAVSHALATARLEPGSRTAGRVSMRDLVRMADHRRIASDRRWLEAWCAARDLASPLARARRFRTLSKSPDTDRAARAWLESRASIAASLRLDAGDGTPDATARVAPAAWAEAESPVRIDLAGGWSDTPPMCVEHGGAVLNAAATLNGAAPIRARGRWTQGGEACVRIRSEDLDREVTLTRLDEVLDHRDPRDWSALPRAALAISGIVAEPGTRESLAERLGAIAGATRLELTLSSGVPKGSGLGTSSILAAAVLACLDRLLGRAHAIERVLRRAGAIEQMIGTGGGWQDQAGGALPGVKLLETSPGTDQVPRASPITVPGHAEREWAARSLLAYTGLQRLAADILHQVVGRYLDDDPDLARAIGALTRGARDGASALEHGSIDDLARVVRDYWALKRAVDPGACTPAIEAMVEPVRGLLSAWELPGAGGGGFVYMIAKDEEAARRARSILSASGARVFDHAIARDGLRVRSGP